MMKSSHPLSHSISALIGRVFTVTIFCSLAISAATGDELFPPTDYIHSKLQQDDIVFLGTTHKKPEILSFIADLITSLKGLGVTHFVLEIPSDQQKK